MDTKSTFEKNIRKLYSRKAFTPPIGKPSCLRNSLEIIEIDIMEFMNIDESIPESSSPEYLTTESEDE